MVLRFISISIRIIFEFNFLLIKSTIYDHVEKKKLCFIVIPLKTIDHEYVTPFKNDIKYVLRVILSAVTVIQLMLIGLLRDFHDRIIFYENSV